MLGFPLHPAGKPSIERAEHLGSIRVPMLFLQGPNDTLAELPLLGPVVAGLEGRATRVTFEAADHSCHVPVGSGRTDVDVLAGLVRATVSWTGGHGG